MKIDTSYSYTQYKYSEKATKISRWRHSMLSALFAYIFLFTLLFFFILNILFSSTLPYGITIIVSIALGIAAFVGLSFYLAKLEKKTAEQDFAKLQEEEKTQGGSTGQ